MAFDAGYEARAEDAGSGELLCRGPGPPYYDLDGKDKAGYCAGLRCGAGAGDSGSGELLAEAHALQ